MQQQIAIVILSIGAILFMASLVSKRKIIFLLGIGIIISGLITLSYYQVDEGEVIVLTQFGKVHRSITNAGPNLKRPWSLAFPFPKRQQSMTLKIDARSKDGSVVPIDITIRYRVNPDKIKDIYINVAKNVKSLEDNIIIPDTRSSLRDAFSTLEVKEIYEKRSLIKNQIKQVMYDQLYKNHIIVVDLAIRDIKFPEKVESAIQKKLEAQQEAEAAIFRKQQASIDAEIKKIEAEGVAEAQKIINKTLTPYYIQHEAIQAYKELANSPNSTFVIMPTSAKGAGIPIILNGTGSSDK